LTIQEVLGKLQGARQSGGQWTAKCPAHEDRENSLSIGEKDDKILLHCFAGCETEAICRALGIQVSELFSKQERGAKERPRKGAKTQSEKRKVVSEYVYRDGNGREVAKKVRYEPKSFLWFRAEWETAEVGQKLAWCKGLGGAKTPLYRWNEVKESDSVCLTEGEKDADAGGAAGLPCSTSGGVNSWRDDHAEQLNGKRVIIIADSDDPGRLHAAKVAQSLWTARENAGVFRAAQVDGQESGSGIKVVEIPGHKDLSAALEAGVPVNVIQAMIEDAKDWKPEAGADVLDEIYYFIRQYVIFGESEARACALWVAHTYAFKAAEYTPYLSIESPEKRSGKSRLLDVLEMLVREPWKSDHATPAAAVRKVDSLQPTLLLDEVDTIFGGDASEYKETMRGMLNGGFHLGGSFSACVGQGANISYKDFSSFCPKALAGIGSLPDTIRDRSLRISMQRAPKGMAVKMRIRRVRPGAQKIAQKAAVWVASIEKALMEADPHIPESLDDRQVDFCEPLLAIADAAGGLWPKIARDSLTEMCARAEKSEDSIGVELLKDMRALFDAEDDGGLFRESRERIASADIAKELGEMEGRPWAEWRRGAPLTASSLARLLKRYRIGPLTTRFDDGRRTKGYHRKQFEDVWSRYCPENEN
jgi:Protein of unknown function (DUF3631)